MTQKHAAGEQLTHLNKKGEARMVDIGAKDATERKATAQCKIVMRAETLRLIMEGGIAKGDVLAVARTAGIMASKRTHEIIPLCHNIPLNNVGIGFAKAADGKGIVVTGTASAVWKTGVEMEALTAVAVAALTVYDMAKSVDKAITIETISLMTKSGGKSGDYKAERILK